MNPIALNAGDIGAGRSSRSIKCGDRHIQQSFEFAGFFLGKGGEQARFNRSDHVRSRAMAFLTRVRNVGLLDPAVNRMGSPHNQAVSFEGGDQGLHRLGGNAATPRQFGA